MAATEARAVWQRTANRCFVQEDAKRAPKLACCQQSSSAASTKQVVDPEISGAIDLADHSSGSFMPRYENSAYPNLLADTKWWLQTQPNYMCQKGFNSHRLKTLEEEEMETLKTEFINSPFRDTNKIGEKFFKGFEYDKMQEFVDMMETGEECVYVERDISGKLNEMYFVPDSPWISSKKAKPWWRATDKDELAFLVAQKSLDHIENCDLPPPQRMHNGLYPNGNTHCSGSFGSVVHERSSLDSVKVPRKPRATDEIGHMDSGSEKSVSSSSTNNNMDTSRTTETQASETDLIKTQLLEALRHSQTRAREAEKAAKEANAEKDHVVTLFFKQASQLFAYKQWFQLLQLEALYLQIKNTDKSIMSAVFPGSLPWMPCKGRKPMKGWQKGKKGNLGREWEGGFREHVVAFALGLSLVGAGLILGWTVGWMLPF